MTTLTTSPRQAAFRTFAASDGTELFYRHWPAPTPPEDGSERAVVMLHRGHEHSGRMEHIVQELGLDRFHFFAWDARGHGQSPGRRGDAPDIETLVRDVDGFVRHIAAAHGIPPENMIVLAQSVGAVLAAAWAHDYAPPVRGLILGSPAFRIKLYVPFARQAIALRLKLCGNFFVNSYVKAGLLTHDQERAASFRADPLISRAVSARLLTGLHALSERIVADASAIAAPVRPFILCGDVVGRPAPPHRLFGAAPRPLSERLALPGFFHDTFGERDRDQAFAAMRAFIDSIFAPPRERGTSRLPAPVRSALLWADRVGPSARTYRRLEAPLPLSSLRGLGFRLLRRLLPLAAPLSPGLKLGRDTGFDSGATLDYVYRNTVGGRTAPGRLLDGIYLNSPGWTGIRRRKELVEELLELAARRLRAKGLPVRILDIAAGHGRYVLDMLEKIGPDGWDEALLRDIDPHNVETARRRATERGLAGRVRCVTGDAFDAAGLAAIRPRPTLVVVSGLYELFPDNGPVLASLRGLAAAVADGGYLVYTNQPWHPQQEFIARVLTSHRGGGPWIMRCRSQAEMDSLAAEAGFIKTDQRMETQGIFSVALARRMSAQSVDAQNADTRDDDAGDDDKLGDSRASLPA